MTKARAYLARVLLWTTAVLTLAGSPAAVRAADSAVVFMYHRFGETAYPSTNIKLDQFEAHVSELKSGKYTVLGLPEIVRRLRSGDALPDRAVGISIDDAYSSVYTQAWPRLREAGLPFTLFVATRPVDRGLKNYMTWAQVKELKDAGVTIGSQTATHLHMAKSSLPANRQDLEASNARFREMLGQAPALFAYPYGEASLAVAKLVKDLGFTAAFGQHSGAISRVEGSFYLPRFAMNETYGTPGRFLLAANALALPAADWTPADHTLTSASDNPPAMGFTVAGDGYNLKRLTCYTSHDGRARIERIGARVEVRAAAPFPKGRTRLNCTLPAKDGRWYWLGRQFYVPD